MVSKLRKLLKDESGITALETAIILIAFVVVASVFAFTILSAGTSSTEKSKDAIYTGLENVEGSMQVVGSVIAQDTEPDNDVDVIKITLASAGGAGIDMTASAGANKVVIDYQDKDQYKTGLTWTTDWLVCEGACKTDDTACDDLLEENEQIMIIISNLSETQLTTKLGTDTDFVILIKPPTGGVIPVERRTPSDFTKVMDLH